MKYVILLFVFTVTYAANDHLILEGIKFDQQRKDEFITETTNKQSLAFHFQDLIDYVVKVRDLNNAISIEFSELIMNLDLYLSSLEENSPTIFSILRINEASDKLLSHLNINNIRLDNANYWVKSRTLILEATDSENHYFFEREFLIQICAKIKRLRSTIKKCLRLFNDIGLELETYEEMNKPKEVIAKYITGIIQLIELYDEDLFQETGRLIEKIVEVKDGMDEPIQSDNNRKRKFDEDN